MVMMVGLPSSEGYATSEQIEGLEQLAQGFANLVAPLARVSSEAELKSLLESLSLQFTQLRAEVVQVISSLVPISSLRIIGTEFVSHFFSTLQERLEARRDLFGEESLEQISGSLDSLAAYTALLLEKWQEGLAAFNKIMPVLLLTGKQALHADMIVTALQAILQDMIPDWEPGAIPILSKAVDDLMTEIEDTFLERSPVLEESSDLVPASVVREHLGL